MLLIFGTKLDDSGISENHQFRLHYQKQRYLIIHFAYFFIEIEKQLVFGTTLDLTGGKESKFPNSNCTIETIVI